MNRPVNSQPATSATQAQTCLARLTYPLGKPEKERPMSIIAGFHFDGGIPLCADSEYTGCDFTTEEPKLFFAESALGSAIFGFAGFSRQSTTPPCQVCHSNRVERLSTGKSRTAPMYRHALPGTRRTPTWSKLRRRHAVLSGQEIQLLSNRVYRRIGLQATPTSATQPARAAWQRSSSSVASGSPSRIANSR